MERELIPAWLRLCKETVALMYALDVGNSDGKVAADVLNVLFKNVPYKELVQNFRSIAGNFHGFTGFTLTRAYLHRTAYRLMEEVLLVKSVVAREVA